MYSRHFLKLFARNRLVNMSRLSRPQLISVPVRFYSRPTDSFGTKPIERDNLRHDDNAFSNQSGNSSGPGFSKTHEASGDKKAAPQKKVKYHQLLYFIGFALGSYQMYKLYKLMMFYHGIYEWVDKLPLGVQGTYLNSLITEQIYLLVITSN